MPNGGRQGIIVASLLRLLHVTFDLSTVALGILDVISDVLVCIEFYNSRLFVSFGICLLIIVNANIVYTHFAVEQGLLKSPPLFGCAGVRIYKALGRHPWKRSILYSLVFPVAQVLPALNWFLCTFLPEKEKGSQKPAPRANLMIDSLHGALEQHWRTHGLFFVETVVEAIPQSILQVVVITIRQEVTPVQILSVALSIVSILSKAYALSLSLDMKVFFLKMMMLSYDVLAMFFSFSSLFTRPYDSQQCYLLFWGQCHVSPLACVWLWYFLLLCPVFILGGFINGLYLPARAVHDGQSIKSALRQVCFWASVWLPAVILLPVPRLSPLVLLIHLYEPGGQTSREAIVLMAKLFNFMCSSRGQHWRAKVQHINLYLARHFEKLYKNTYSAEHYAVLLHSVLCCHRVRQWCLALPFAPADHPPLYRSLKDEEPDGIPEDVSMSKSCTLRLRTGVALHQEVYRCHTCCVDVCDPCAQTCHWRHKLEFLRKDKLQCQCSTHRPCKMVFWFQPILQRPAAAAQPPPTSNGPSADAAAPAGGDGGAAAVGPPRAPAPGGCTTRRCLRAAYPGIVFLFHGFWIVFGVAFLPFYLLGVLYPWLAVGLGVHPLNGLHRFTWYLMVVLVPLIVFLSLWALPQYFRFILHCNFNWFGSLATVQNNTCLPSVPEMTKTYYTPSPDQVLQFVLPRALTFPDIVSRVGIFLGSEDIILSPRAMVSITLFPDRGAQRHGPRDCAVLEISNDGTPPPGPLCLSAIQLDRDEADGVSAAAGPVPHSEDAARLPAGPSLPCGHLSRLRGVSSLRDLALCPLHHRTPFAPAQVSPSAPLSPASSADDVSAAPLWKCHSDCSRNWASREGGLLGRRARSGSLPCASRPVGWPRGAHNMPKGFWAPGDGDDAALRRALMEPPPLVV